MTKTIQSPSKAQETPQFSFPHLQENLVSLLYKESFKGMTL
jgi:hypothetical protein